MSPAPRRRPVAKPAAPEFGLFGASTAPLQDAAGPNAELADKTCLMLGCSKYPSFNFGRSGALTFACWWHRGFLNFEASPHE